MLNGYAKTEYENMNMFWQFSRTAHIILSNSGISNPNENLAQPARS